MARGRGRGGRGRGGRGRGRGRPGAEGDDGSESGEEYEDKPRIGGQSATAGMLPPSDSDEDEDDEVPAPKAKAGQPATAGMLPPSDSDEDDDEEDDSSEEEEEEPPKKPLRPAVPTAAKKKEEEEIDPEQLRKDMERLEMIKRKREEDRLKRVADEGWDRFAPESETNRRPDTTPKDYPGKAGVVN